MNHSYLNALTGFNFDARNEGISPDNTQIPIDNKTPYIAREIVTDPLDELPTRSKLQGI